MNSNQPTLENESLLNANQIFKDLRILFIQKLCFKNKSIEDLLQEYYSSEIISCEYNKPNSHQNENFALIDENQNKNFELILAIQLFLGEDQSGSQNDSYRGLFLSNATLDKLSFFDFKSIDIKFGKVSKLLSEILKYHKQNYEQFDQIIDGVVDHYFNNNNNKQIKKLTFIEYNNKEAKYKNFSEEENNKYEEGTKQDVGQDIKEYLKGIKNKHIIDIEPSPKRLIVKQRLTTIIHTLIFVPLIIGLGPLFIPLWLFALLILISLLFIFAPLFTNGNNVNNHANYNKAVNDIGTVTFGITALSATLFGFSNKEFLTKLIVISTIISLFIAFIVLAKAFINLCFPNKYEEVGIEDIKLNSILTLDNSPSAPPYTNITSSYSSNHSSSNHIENDDSSSTNNDDDSPPKYDSLFTIDKITQNENHINNSKGINNHYS